MELPAGDGVVAVVLVDVHRAVAAQVDPFEKANFETSFSLDGSQWLKPGALGQLHSACTAPPS